LWEYARYWVGVKSGSYLFRREDTFSSRRNIYQSKEFFDKYGTKAIVFARFLLLSLRTFAPVIAGIVEMDKKKFMFYNVRFDIMVVHFNFRRTLFI
jgi:membrane-associated protein